MIIYLDTVNSSGHSGQIPNENYARELMELFTFGADNGYDQNDVIAMARVWTGWRSNIVDPENRYQILAPKTANKITEKRRAATDWANACSIVRMLKTAWSLSSAEI